MDYGGSDVLTPEMVLAAAEPPPEALARAARAPWAGKKESWAWLKIGARRLLWSKSHAATD
eukprot:SAG11_NODE_3615_length_2337_cov_1.871761_3_plen_61_part_00